MLIRFGSMIVLSVALSASCSEISSPEQALRDVPRQHAVVQTTSFAQERQFAEIAKAVGSGYAGHWYDTDGTMVVMVVDPAAAASRMPQLQTIAAYDRRYVRRGTGHVRIQTAE